MRDTAELPVTMLLHHDAALHAAPAVWIGAVQIGAVPLRCCATLCPCHSYPRNSMPSQVQPYQCSAVAPADHCVTVRARPSQCRSDHLMTPAFRLTSGHNPCSVIPCKTAHPQSLRISRLRSCLSSPSRPLPRLRFAYLHIASALPIMSRPCCALPWLISPASCCTAAALCPSRPSPSIPCPICPVQCHLIGSRRNAMHLRRASPLSVSQLFSGNANLS